MAVDWTLDRLQEVLEVVDAEFNLHQDPVLGHWTAIFAFEDADLFTTGEGATVSDAVQRAVNEIHRKLTLTKREKALEKLLPHWAPKDGK